MERSIRQSWFARLAPVIVFGLVLLAQLPLILNPGYFSHDELQWAAFAAQGRVFAWTAVDAFQYRPLTFNLWLWLSRHLFAHPQAMHAVLVAWGAGNSALLCMLARRFGMALGPALIGALVFALGPYAAYVHGWVGTIADLAWLTCALLTGLLVRNSRSVMAAAFAAALLTAIGLLAKEAAFSIPPLLALAWWFDGRQRRWAAATLASGAVAALYLALRIGALLHAPHDGAQYALSLANMPMRWLEYQLFPPIPTVFETFNTLGAGMNTRIAGAAVLWVALLAALCRSEGRLAGLFLLGGLAALAPVLPLGSSSNHYGYGFAAISTAAAAAAWPGAPRWGRAVMSVIAVLCVWHGVNVMRQLRHVGEVQAVFSPALAEVVRNSARPLRLRPASNVEDWIFVRLSHDIPSYGGVAIGDRIAIVAADTPADYRIEADGRLTPLR